MLCRRNGTAVLQPTTSLFDLEQENPTAVFVAPHRASTRMVHTDLNFVRRQGYLRGAAVHVDAHPSSVALSPSADAEQASKAVAHPHGCSCSPAHAAHHSHTEGIGRAARQRCSRSHEGQRNSPTEVVITCHLRLEGVASSNSVGAAAAAQHSSSSRQHGAAHSAPISYPPASGSCNI